MFRKHLIHLLVVISLAGGLLVVLWLSAGRADGAFTAQEGLALEYAGAVRSMPVAPLIGTSSLTLTLSGPDTAAPNEVVTYTVNYSGTLGGALGIEYIMPSGFTVISTDPVTSTMLGDNVLRWDSSKLAGRNLITVTGRHTISGCPPATHTARFYDIYNPDASLPEDSKNTTVGGCIYVPLVFNNYPWVSPFGVESNVSLASGTISTRAIELGVGWIRLNGRISWRELQPNEGDPIRWDLLTDFENELRALKAAGLTPIIIVDDHPQWATINNVRDDGQPTSCGAIRSDKFEDFAQFVRALVARYKTPEFDVHHWELGNEPDVDPNLVPPNNVFGCWGDIDDPYYGGRHYGEMLKVVGAAIKAEDPAAQVWIGGLLLDRPNTTDPAKGKPELFLQGILEAGAAPYFDVVPYHSYPPYLNGAFDHDNAIGGPWDSWGGGYVGKARYLRQLMSQYGIEKPVFLNETGLMCPDYYEWCTPPDAEFYQMQANHIVRAFVRGISENIKGFIWYTLNGPGWRYTGLLDGDADPKPVYIAYQQLILQLQNTRYVGPVDYGGGIEAYSFRRGLKYVHVVWAEENQIIAITIPQSEFVEARDRDGNLITPTLVGSDYQLQVGFEPIYIVRIP